jgi:hypothetical protein
MVITLVMVVVGVCISVVEMVKLSIAVLITVIGVIGVCSCFSL